MYKTQSELEFKSVGRRNSLFFKKAKASEAQLTLFDKSVHSTVSALTLISPPAQSMALVHMLNKMRLSREKRGLSYVGLKLEKNVDGRYKILKGEKPALIEPEKLYIFVVMADGNIRIALREGNQHLNLAEGMAVRYAGTLKFKKEDIQEKGVSVEEWTNKSTHYRPLVALAHQAGLDLNLFEGYVFEPLTPLSAPLPERRVAAKDEKQIEASVTSALAEFSFLSQKKSPSHSLVRRGSESEESVSSDHSLFSSEAEESYSSGSSEGRQSPVSAEGYLSSTSEEGYSSNRVGL